MINLLLLCSTLLINSSNEPWNDFDNKVLKSATKTCYTRYDKSCLVRFIKLEPKNYQAICGKGE